MDYDIGYDEINDHDRDDTYEYQQDVDENLKMIEQIIMLTLQIKMMKKSLKNKVKMKNLNIIVIWI